MVRADGLFRAVRLVAGPHVVEFVYYPRDFAVGLAISSTVALVLVGLALAKPRRSVLP
jgi:hypothetical protein